MIKVKNLVLMVFLLGFFAPLAQAAAVNEKSNFLRVMTFNIRREGKEKKKEHIWRNRLPLVVNVITSTQPDIIGFQEAKKHQIDGLVENLGNYAWVGRGRGKSWFGLGVNEFTPLFYNEAKVSLIDCGTFSINHVNLFRLNKTGTLPRICTWGKFQYKSSGEEFYVYNTHLDNSHQKARLRSLEVIRKDINRRTSTLPVILMGDFNMGITQDVKSRLQGFYVAKDAAQQKCGTSTTHMPWDGQRPSNIDHVLINDNKVLVARYEVLSSRASDHSPVLVDLVK